MPSPQGPSEDRQPQGSDPAAPDDGSAFTPDVDERARAASTGAGAPAPALTKLGQSMRQGVAVRSIGITTLAVLALFYTLYAAQDFFLPVAFAIVLNFLFSPAVRALARVHVAEPVGAGVMILALVGGIAFAGYELSGPAQRWAAAAPRSLSGAAEKLRDLRRPMEQVTRSAEEVQNATGGTGSAQEVVVKEPGVGVQLVDAAQHFVVGALEAIVLLYFLLAAGDLFLQKLVRVLPQLEDKRKAVQIAREAERSISAYLSTFAMLNFGLGVAVTLGMWAVGMPNPLLWGVLAALLEFVPYLGAATMIGILTLAGLSTFEAVPRALLVPAVYLAIDFVQANFIYPVVLGRRLTLNPVAIFVGILFWFFLWGVPGAFLAVPLIATFKIFCDHIETLAPVGEFLGK